MNQKGRVIKMNSRWGNGGGFPQQGQQSNSNMNGMGGGFPQQGQQSNSNMNSMGGGFPQQQICGIQTTPFMQYNRSFMQGGNNNIQMPQYQQGAVEIYQQRQNQMQQIQGQQSNSYGGYQQTQPQGQQWGSNQQQIQGQQGYNYGGYPQTQPQGQQQVPQQQKGKSMPKKLNGEVELNKMIVCKVPYEGLPIDRFINLGIDNEGFARYIFYPSFTHFKGASDVVAENSERLILNICSIADAVCNGGVNYPSFGFNYLTNYNNAKELYGCIYDYGDEHINSYDGFLNRPITTKYGKLTYRYLRDKKPFTTTGANQAKSDFGERPQPQAGGFGMGMNSMGMGTNSMGMNGMGMGNMNSMGMNNMGMNSMGTNSMGTNSMGMNSMGMNNMGMNNMSTNSMGMNNMGMGMNNMGMNMGTGQIQMGMINMGMGMFGNNNNNTQGFLTSGEAMSEEDKRIYEHYMKDLEWYGLKHHSQKYDKDIYNESAEIYVYDTGSARKMSAYQIGEGRPYKFIINSNDNRYKGTHKELADGINNGTMVKNCYGHRIVKLTEYKVGDIANLVSGGVK